MERGEWKEKNRWEGREGEKWREKGGWRVREGKERNGGRRREKGKW